MRALRRYLALRNRGTESQRVRALEATYGSAWGADAFARDFEVLAGFGDYLTVRHRDGRRGTVRMQKATTPTVYFDFRQVAKSGTNALPYYLKGRVINQG